MRILLLALGLAISGAAAAEPALQLGAGSTISLEDDSTLHEYSTKAQAFDASFEMGPAKAGAAPGKDVEGFFRNGEVKTAELLIPTAKLKSGEGGLDDNLYEALGSGEHRNILFHIASYEVLPAKAAGAAFAISIRGQLNAPVLMLGMLKTKDLVTIQFDLNVEEAPPAATTKVN